MRPANRIFSTEDARRLAKRRLPRMVFDFIEGGAGRETGMARNLEQFDKILLQPRVMADVEGRSQSTRLLDAQYDAPFGVAPMGMCNLACPHADRMIAETARELNIPMCLSSAGSSTLESVYEWAGKNVWFQLYFGQSADISLATADRAQEVGYSTLVLTVDVPQVSRRVRDLRNGFTMPFKMTPGAFVDFACHPLWSVSTLFAGVPSPKNHVPAERGERFVRNASRAGADWSFLEKLRKRWGGKLVVKGITSPEDAVRAQQAGVDAIYVSNHGARQLDGVPPSLKLLPIVRQAVGPAMPLLFDSGVRNGEDIVKALILGADFVMLGRPVMYALGANRKRGLKDLLRCLAEDIDITMAQLGTTSVSDLGPHNLFDDGEAADDPQSDGGGARLHVAGQ
ncbi:alpha-hydroxy acid oxidase [Nitratireductor sp. XY-223]|uniref:alpha-hydroxy acid oxidase n=1 Tax=Nitratireductor sp. XY-223 TaxID=2561926 RepID=UPI0010AAB4B1|nr:alpha-hydroxy acid oxidase [Nitratireductor sp. XY-223]